MTQKTPPPFNDGILGYLSILQAYAALTSFHNAAYQVGKITSSNLVQIWDVSNSTLEAGDFSGMWKLSLVTSLIQPLGLVLVWLLPNNSDDQKRLQASSRDRHSFWGGLFFFGFLVGALLCTISQSIAKIFIPV